MIKFLYIMPKRSFPKSKKKSTKKSTKGTKSGGGKKSGGKKGRCWSGYRPTPGKKAFSKGSCMKG